MCRSQRKSQLTQHLTPSLFVSLSLFLSRCAGLRAVDADRDSGDAAGGQRDGARLHICHAQAAADDHIGGGQAAHTDVPQFAGSAKCRRRRSAHVRDRLRGDGAELQHRRRGLQSKTIDLRPSRARSSRPPPGAALALQPRAEPHAVRL